MKNNLKEIKTTILGSLLIVVGLAYFALPYFSDRELWEVNNIYLSVCFIGGILFLVAPDRIVNWAFKWMDKKAQ